MNTDKMRENILNQVENYIDNEALYADDVQLRINPETAVVDIVEPDDEVEGCDYIPVMELVCMSTDAPGQWDADVEAIDSLAAQYSPEK